MSFSFCCEENLTKTLTLIDFVFEVMLHHPLLHGHHRVVLASIAEGRWARLGKQEVIDAVVVEQGKVEAQDFGTS